ncbi:MAG: hypothetical protein N2116_02020 [Armatimonadetes bacterium]|nr:hypothetical protein [Armatimonadota bacterium]
MPDVKVFAEPGKTNVDQPGKKSLWRRWKLSGRRTSGKPKL